MKLFKYLEPRWADQMVNAGAVRIGTLYDFRQQELLGDERGDDEEGLRISFTDGKAAILKGRQLPFFVREALTIAPEQEFQFADGAILHVRQSSRDVYVYCVCSKFDVALMRLFGGACVEIVEPEAYFGAITPVLDGWTSVGVRKLTSFALRPCEYVQRKQTWPYVTPYNPVFRKSPAYAHQAEVRAVWNTPEQNIRPINLTVPGVRAFCRRIL